MSNKLGVPDPQRVRVNKKNVFQAHFFRNGSGNCQAIYRLWNDFWGEIWRELWRGGFRTQFWSEFWSEIWRVDSGVNFGVNFGMNFGMIFLPSGEFWVNFFAFTLVLF